jgi:predicted CxxxxCH...CXXCH cytochrome family protein
LRSKAERVCLAAGAFLIATLAVFVASGGYAGVVNSPHDFSLSTGLSTKSSTVAPGGVCSACHIPHGSLDNVLWARSLTGINNYSTLLTLDGNPSGELNYRPGYTLQCYDCHDYHFPGGIDDLPAFNGFAVNHKPQDVAFGFQIRKRDDAISLDASSTMKEDAPGGSYSGYYENSPPYQTAPSTNYGANPNPSPSPRTDNVALAKTGGHYFKSGDPNASQSIYRGDKLPCSDCHDPHKWAPNWQAFFSPRIQTTNATQWSNVFNNPALGSSATPVGSEFMANPLQVGNRTGNDQSSRKLCIVCHGTSSDSTSPGPVISVSFTQVNPRYNNPVPTLVRPSAGISEHQSSSNVACVSCHQHNMIDASCSMCHGFPPSDTALVRYPASFTPAPDASGVNDSHARHVGNKQGEAKNSSGPYAFACGVCHYGSAMGFDTALGHHQNNRVSVVIQGIWTNTPNGPGGLWDNTNYFNQAFPAGGTGQLDNSNVSGGWGSGSRLGGDSCQNVYCHSVGRAPAGMTHDCTADFPRPAWLSGPVHCNDCHGVGTTTTADNVFGTFNYGMPNYANGGTGLRANSHAAHVVKNGIECTTCHFNSVTGTGAGRAVKGTSSTPHVNGIRDVNFDTSVTGGTPSYDNVGKTCSVSCHGTGTPPIWGQVNLTCFSCHAGAESAAKPQPNQAVPSPVDNVQYLSTGHGRTATNYPGDSNPPAGFDNVVSGPPECFVCHAYLSKHIGRGVSEITNDPYRLGSATIPGRPGGLGTFTGNFADNVDLLCLGCHGNSTQRAGHDNAAKGTRTIDAQTHARGITGTNYATWPVSSWKCVDCHDPHGDGNLKMVRSGINAPTATGDTTLSGSDSKGTPKRTTVTAVTFTSTAGMANGSYASASPKGQGVCEICHTQTPLFSRSGLGNVGSHVTRTGRCTTCHVHTAGFKGLGGPDIGQYFDRSFQAPIPLLNIQDNSSHPLRGLTTTDNTLRFTGESENCLACHYSSGPARTSDECIMCHFEDQLSAPATNHMDGILQMAAVTGNTRPTSAFAISTLADYDAWCLQCHGTTTVSLGSRFPSAGARTVLSATEFAAGRHRANTVGCIYCHQPHGSGNAQLVRTGPANRSAAGATVMRFNVFPNDNTGSYGTPVNQNIWYRARVDNVSPNAFADAADENNFCNKACHIARLDASFSKERYIKRDGTTGLYQLTGLKKTYITEGIERTNDNISVRNHGHVNNEIISTDDMVTWFASLTGKTGPGHFRYPGSGNANPATYNNLTSPLPFFPDYADGSRDFTNGYLNQGLIRYRFTCSTCHNPHGTPYSTQNTIGGEAYPDLRMKRLNPNELCVACHK